MKSSFFEHYDPSEEEINTIWNNCIFSFDTNSLLNLYRYSEQTKDQFIQVLKDIEKRIILTHQVGYEFHKNRLTKIDAQKLAYDEVNKSLTDKFNELTSHLNKYKYHSYIDVSVILEVIDSMFKGISKRNDELKKTHPNFDSEDPIKNIISELFDKKITIPYNQQQLEKTFKEGKERYSKKIPPGYADEKNKQNSGDLSLYGDVIIWYQILDFAKENNKPIILVTDDSKEDWWQKFNGKTISPRPELLREFYDATKQKILIYNADTFLRMASKQINANINETTLKEIKDLRLDDEFTLVGDNELIIYTKDGRKLKQIKDLEELIYTTEEIELIESKFGDDIIQREDWVKKVFQNRYGDIKMAQIEKNENYKKILNKYFKLISNDFKFIQSNIGYDNLVFNLK